jgi:hypothetical protein
VGTGRWEVGWLPAHLEGCETACSRRAIGQPGIAQNLRICWLWISNLCQTNILCSSKSPLDTALLRTVFPASWYGILGRDSPECWSDDRRRAGNGCLQGPWGNGPSSCSCVRSYESANIGVPPSTKNSLSNPASVVVCWGFVPSRRGGGTVSRRCYRRVRRQRNYASWYDT